MENNKKEKQDVAILECSQGNDTVGDMWLETFICKPTTTVKELIDWKKGNYSKGKLIITEASEPKDDDDLSF